jgi:AraC family transcriptional regulator
MLREPGFYGTTVRERAFADFTFTERAYPAGYSTPAHVHQRPLFCIVLDGSYEEVNGGRSHDCTSSTILFHAAHEEHLERFGRSGGRSLIVEIEPEWYSRIQEVAPGGVRTAACDGGSLRTSGGKLYREFLTGDEASRLIIEGLLLEISGEFLRVRDPAERHAPKWLDEVRDYVRTNFSQRITLAAIGMAANVHPVHVAQTFRRFHHCTIGDYLRKLRIEFACQELAHTEAPLADIAARAGFSDQSHFNRTFKKMVGMAPSQYRNCTRNPKPPCSWGNG